MSGRLSGHPEYRLVTLDHKRQNLKLSKLQNDCSSSKQNKKVNDRAKMIVRVAFTNISEMIVKNDCQNDRDSKNFEK